MNYRDCWEVDRCHVMHTDNIIWNRRSIHHAYILYMSTCTENTHTHTNEIVSKLLTSSDHHHNYISQTNFYTTHLKLYGIRHYLKNFRKTTNIFSLLGCKSVSLRKSFLMLCRTVVYSSSGSSCPRKMAGPEDECMMILQNIRNYLLNTASHAWNYSTSPS